MKILRTAILTIITILALKLTVAAQAPGMIQNVANSNGNNTLTVNLTPIFTNDSLVACGSVQSANILSISDGVNNWQLVRALLDSTNGDDVEIWWAPNAAPGPTAITLIPNTGGTSKWLQLNVQEVRGITGPDKSAVSSTGGSGTTITSPSTGTLSVPNEYVLACAAMTNQDTPSSGPTNGFIGLTLNATGFAIFPAYFLSTTTTSVNTAWTVSSTPWDAIIASFFGASSTPPSAATLQHTEIF